MKFGAQQHIENLMAVTWPNMIFLHSRWRTVTMLKIIFWPKLSNRLPDFSEILRGEQFFHKISTMGQIPAFHRKYFSFRNQSGLGFRIVSDTLVRSGPTKHCGAIATVRLFVWNTLFGIMFSNRTRIRLGTKHVMSCWCAWSYFKICRFMVMRPFERYSPSDCQ